MKFWRRNHFLPLTGFILLAGLTGLSQAQVPSVPSAGTTSNGTPGVPPAPSAVKCPVDFFRELLAMNVAERKEALADRTPDNRRQILAKVRQYETLKPDEREIRLKVTELRWYLLPLLRAPATNRQEQLSGIPKETRQLIEDRLQAWDILPPDLQKELLDNEATMRYLCELGSQKPSTSTLSTNRVQQGLALWQNLPEDQKRRLLARFDQVFGLNEREKQKVLKTLSDPERQQIEKTLKRFGSLSQAQRAECIQSFEKFTNLSVEERQQFLKNAERWKLMSPAERQQWKEVVQKLTPQPPLPPGFGQPAPPPPPGTPPRRSLLSTNGN